VIDGILGIDVSKNTLDASMSSCNKVGARRFANSSDGWRHLLDWLITQKVRRVHACLESTGRYSLGSACALCEAGHVVSIVNPAQIRDFARTKLGRNKTDGVDASHIREYHASGRQFTSSEITQLIKRLSRSKNPLTMITVSTATTRIAVD
jgi:transposase